MKKTKLVAIRGCCLFVLAAGCAGSGKPYAAADGGADVGRDVVLDTPAGTAVDAGLLPSPVLDPNGTYGGKTYAEWLAASVKHYMELPDGTDVVKYTGASCAVGQSLAPSDGGAGADAFFLGGALTGKVTLSCTIPSGEMIVVPLFTGAWDNASVPPGTLTDAQLRSNLAAFLATTSELSLEIDGKPYGRKVADFAAYFTEPTAFSYTMPGTPTNWCNTNPDFGCRGFSGPMNSFCGGYQVLLAPLAPGPHTIHTVAVASTASWTATWDTTYDLTIADAGTLAAMDGGADSLALPVSTCSGPASGAMIDDMSGPALSLAPPSCGSPGGWSVLTTPPGTISSPTGDPAVLSNCGSLCQSLAGPRPAGFPETTTFDAGPLDAAALDGGTSPPQAMCIAGQTAPQQYAWSGLTLTFAYSGTRPSATGPVKIVTPSFGFTTDPPPALIDASQYSGIEFWLWASADTAAAMSAGFVVELIDENQLPGAGVCQPNLTSGTKPCSGASAGIAFSTAAGSQGTGSLLAADGSEMTTLVSGWQHVHAPWKNFVANPYYGGANEKTVDPTTLAFAQFVIQQDGANAIAIPFNYCVYRLKFYQ